MALDAQTVLNEILARPKYQARLAELIKTTWPGKKAVITITSPYGIRPLDIVPKIVLTLTCDEDQYYRPSVNIKLGQMPSGCGMVVTSDLSPFDFSNWKAFGVLLMDLVVDVTKVMAKAREWGMMLVATTNEHQDAANEYFRSHRWKQSAETRNRRTKNKMYLWTKNVLRYRATG